MAYTGLPGRRPFERASKASHQHIINDSSVKNLLGSCWLPQADETIDFGSIIYQQEPAPPTPDVKHIIAIDAGYSEVVVKPRFPSATVAFFQFGALLFQKEDLLRLDRQSFIEPRDIAKLKEIERLKLAIPTRQIHRREQKTLTHTVRWAVHDFCRRTLDGASLLSSLAWFLFRQFKPIRTPEDQTFHLPTGPYGDEVVLRENQFDHDYMAPGPRPDAPIYLTDIFRLHERIDDELGAGGVLAYISGALEHLLLIHYLRLLRQRRVDSLKEVFFLKDGPTGFFGLTARLHEPMQELVAHLFDSPCLLLAGLEKTGTFVEHAKAIANSIPAAHFLLLNNDYIYRNILPAPADLNRPYADTSNYGQKLIFKTRNGQIYVVSVPVRQLKTDPKPTDLPYLSTILAQIEALRCDIYQDSLLPIALVNKLISLSDRPSSSLLQKFAIQSVQRA
jgi:hypothetical protein